MGKRTTHDAVDKRRDIFDWVGVAVNVVQAFTYVAATIGLLYWYMVSGGALPAVLVGLTVTVVVLLGCTVYVMLAVRRSASSTERHLRTLPSGRDTSFGRARVQNPKQPSR
jgi:hypothetical protein